MKHASRRLCAWLIFDVGQNTMDAAPKVAVTKEELASEARSATEILRGKSVKTVWRHTPTELGIEFDDGSRLFVDARAAGLELSIT